MTADPAWIMRAACRGMPTRMFFPSEHDNATTSAAKKVCAVCPVGAECRTAGRYEAGIWGGVGEKSRSHDVTDIPRPHRVDVWHRPITHGTDADYMAHRRRGEDACDDCKAAHNVAQKARAEHRGTQ